MKVKHDGDGPVEVPQEGLSGFCRVLPGEVVEVSDQAGESLVAQGWTKEAKNAKVRPDPVPPVEVVETVVEEVAPVEQGDEQGNDGSGE